MEKIILQIGRLDKNIEQDIKFKFHDKNYKHPLSSLALSEHFSNERNNENEYAIKVILLYPVSLPLNEQFKTTIQSSNNNYNILFQKLSHIVQCEDKKKEYLNNPETLYSIHPHVLSDNSFIVLHSLGNYLEIDLKTTLHDVVLNIWAFLIKEYLCHQINEIYIDISSGLNFYITALMEALRYFLVWAKLYNIGNNNIVKGYISYTDPILGRSEQTINIYTYEVIYKAFFTSPFGYQDLNVLAKNVIEKGLDFDRKTKANVKQHLESFLTIFSCFENAAPLFLYMNDFQNTNDIEDTIKIITNAILSQYKNNWYSSPGFDFNNFSKVLNALAFFNGLKKIMENIYKNNQGYATLDCLEKFCEVLRKLKLQPQANILHSELYNNFKHSDFDKKYTEQNTLNDWIYLCKLLQYEQTCIQNLNERNFFAHAGFERTVTMVKKENEDILIKYDESKLQEIKQILLNRVK